MKWLSLLSLIVLMGCSSLSKEECMQEDWEHHGQQDALKGKPSSTFNEYEKACLKHDIELSKDIYMRGHKHGLQDFCTYKKGYEDGLNGEQPFPECATVGSTFDAGYKKGLEEYEIINSSKKLTEREEKIKEDAINSIIRRYGKTCNSNLSCQKNGVCTLNKCDHDGSTCKSSADCKMVGHCKTKSEYVPGIKNWVSAKVCDY